jgi:hypothetical protein
MDEYVRITAGFEVRSHTGMEILELSIPKTLLGQALCESLPHWAIARHLTRAFRSHYELQLLETLAQKKDCAELCTLAAAVLNQARPEARH